MKRWLINKLYPNFECERCFGQEYGQTCYCDYHGATAPGEGPSKFIIIARKVAKTLGIIPEYYK